MAEVMKYIKKKLDVAIKKTFKPISGEKNSYSEAAREKFNSVLAVNEMSEHFDFNDLIMFEDFDEEKKYFYTDFNGDIYVGYGFFVKTAVIQGTDIAESINSAINVLPEESVIQSHCVSLPAVEYRLEQWRQASLKRENEAVFRSINNTFNHLKGASFLNSLSNEYQYHTKENLHFILVTEKMTVDFEDENRDEEIKQFYNDFEERKGKVKGNITKTLGRPVDMELEDYHFIMWSLLNPHRVMSEQFAYSNRFNNICKNLNKVVDPDTNIYLAKNGKISFSYLSENPEYNGGIIDVNKVPAQEIFAVPMTIAEFPEHLYMHSTGALIGAADDRIEMISEMFHIYTTAVKINQEKAVRSVKIKKAIINKQLVSDSEYAKNNMEEMFERRDASDVFLKELGVDSNNKAGSGDESAVKMYSGITLYGTKERLPTSISNVKSIYTKNGFRLEEEPNITLPIFLASLPHQYYLALDAVSSGLQRSELVRSFNASCAFHLQDESKGSDPAIGGCPVIGAKGQISYINFFDSINGYNGVVVGTTGSGKSFTLAELSKMMFCMNYKIRIIDIGGSYSSFVESMGGQNFEFDPKKPTSLNPFSSLADDDAFIANKEYIESLIKIMSGIARLEHNGELDKAYNEALISEAVSNAWESMGSFADISTIYDELLELDQIKKSEHKSMIEDHVSHQYAGEAATLAYNMQEYATTGGTYYEWFNGACQLDISNELMTFEFQKVATSDKLRTLLLTVTLNLIKNDVYKNKNPDKKTLILIDEAHQFFKDPIASKPIELLYRKARKHSAACFLGTQSYEDFNLNESSQAILANAYWKITLFQGSQSFKEMIEKNLIPNDPDSYAYKTISSINSINREMAIISGSGLPSIYRLRVHPYNYYMNSSKDSLFLRKTVLNVVSDFYSEILDNTKVFKDDLENLGFFTLSLLQNDFKGKFEFAIQENIKKMASEVNDNALEKHKKQEKKEKALFSNVNEDKGKKIVLDTLWFFVLEKTINEFAEIDVKKMGLKFYTDIKGQGSNK